MPNKSKLSPIAVVENAEDAKLNLADAQASGDAAAIADAEADMGEAEELLSNVSLLALGIEENRHGHEIANSGIVHAAEGFVQAWDSAMRWEIESKGDTLSGVCTVGEMYKVGHKSRRSALLSALCTNYGIVGALSGADKMALQRGFTIASAVRVGVDIQFVDIDVERRGRTVSLRAANVPVGVVFKLRDDKGEYTPATRSAMDKAKSNLELLGMPVPEEGALFDMIANMRVTCVGGEHAVFGRIPSASRLAEILRPIAVGAGLMEPPTPRDSSPKPAQFDASLDYVGKCLDLLAGEGDESEFAPSDAVDSKLRAIADKIAAYFAALDVEDEQGEIQF